MCLFQTHVRDHQAHRSYEGIARNREYDDVDKDSIRLEFSGFARRWSAGSRKRVEARGLRDELRLAIWLIARSLQKAKELMRRLGTHAARKLGFRYVSCFKAYLRRGPGSPRVRPAEELAS